MDTVKLLIVLALIILALRKKVSVGITLFGAGLITALLYQLEPVALLQGYWDLAKSHRFLSLTAVIVLITSLGELLKELKSLENLTDAAKGLPGGNKTAVGMLPMLVGLMPMPGGSLLSAPLVGNVLSDSRYRREFRTAANYWFRHIVEFSWPIYPGIILTEALTGLPIGSVSLMQLPLALLMALFGLIFFTPKIVNDNNHQTHLWLSLYGILKSIWPIPLAIIIYGTFKLDLALSILLGILALILVVRPKRKPLVLAFKKGFSLKLIFLVFGTLSFQTALELSGAIAAIPNLTMQYNLPIELVIFLVCFASGLLTGMVAAFVAMGYTILAGFLYSSGIEPTYIFLAYLSGYLGVILSPTHLCLILTNDYFKSDLLKVYREIAIPVTLMAVFGFLIYLTPWAELFR
ncbi:MAG: DUF401 family protein [candidate division Zixibacteria bacterium]|nr:DUF401 family protein [candidate division Zixibacteria bacterium]